MGVPRGEPGLKGTSIVPTPSRNSAGDPLAAPEVRLASPSSPSAKRELLSPSEQTQGETEIAFHPLRK